MKKFKDWLFHTKEEMGYVLFPPLIDESMFFKKQFKLKDGRWINLGIATLNDLEDIVRIQEACYDGQAPWGRIAVNNELRNKTQSFFLMAYHNSVAVAFIGISSRQDSLHVTNIATHPQFQKNGLGTFLIDTTIEIAKQLQKKRITLEVRISNLKAMELYRRIGFIDGAIKQNYYHNNGEDALDMFYLLEETGGWHDDRTFE